MSDSPIIQHVPSSENLTEDPSIRFMVVIKNKSYTLTKGKLSVIVIVVITSIVSIVTAIVKETKSTK